MSKGERIQDIMERIQLEHGCDNKPQPPPLTAFFSEEKKAWQKKAGSGCDVAATGQGDWQSPRHPPECPWVVPGRKKSLAKKSG